MSACQHVWWVIFTTTVTPTSTLILISMIMMMLMSRWQNKAVLHCCFNDNIVYFNLLRVGPLDCDCDMIISSLHDIRNKLMKIIRCPTEPEAHLRACVRAKGGDFELWQYGNRLSSHWSSEAMFQIRRICFSNRLTIHKLMIKVWHSFVIKNW